MNKPASSPITALLFGASGAVGSKLLAQLLADDRYANVRIAVRRPLAIEGQPKLVQQVVDMQSDAELSASMRGVDQLFCCLGSTIKKAGSKAAFQAVDYALPLRLGQLAKNEGVGRFIVITAMGANPDSSLFYNRVKGELQRDLTALQLPALDIVQPSLLLGDRDESRPGESMGKLAMPVLRPLLQGLLKHYRGIHPQNVARAMVDVANQPPQPCRVHKLGDYA